MGDILFIGKCVGEDDIYGWVDGYYVRLKDPYKNRESHRIYTGFAECDCGEFYGDWYEVDPKTVRQFTGLFDKNGRRIFKDDIVIRQHGSDIPMLVKHDEESASFIVVYTVDKECYENTLCGHMYLEVIGNIHDEPELIKGV